RLERELEDFSYLVTHDLANEFRYVAEYSKLLVQDLQDNAEGASHARIVAQSAVRCQNMLRAIMAYSSVQTQKLMFRRWPGRSIVERALVELDASEAAKSAEVTLDISGEVVGDARLLILAVRLALENASRHRREDTSLVVNIQGATDDIGNWRLTI